MSSRRKKSKSTLTLKTEQGEFHMEDEFQKATRIYRLIGARFLSKPIFLLRNLSYNQPSRNRNRRKSKDKFQVDSMLSNLSVASVDHPRILRVLEFCVEQSWPPNTWARIDLQIIRICGEDGQILNKTFATSLQVSTNGKIQETDKPIPKNSFHAVNQEGETVQVIKLAVRVTILSSEDSNLISENQEFVDSGQENEVLEANSTNNNEEEIVYAGVVTLYDRKGNVNILHETSSELEIPLQKQIFEERTIMQGRVLQPVPSIDEEYLSENNIIRAGRPAKISLALTTVNKDPLLEDNVVIKKCPPPPALEYTINQETGSSTECRDDWRCPWCFINCHERNSLFKHLELCHSLFKFNFLRIHNGARISVTLSEPTKEIIRPFICRPKRKKLVQSVASSLHALLGSIAKKKDDQSMDELFPSFAALQGLNLLKKGVKCPKCDARFTTNSNMRIHLNNIHLKIRYPCLHPGCGMNFTQKGNLVYHQKRNHKILPKTEPGLKQPSRNTPPIAPTLSTSPLSPDRKLRLQSFLKIRSKYKNVQSSKKKRHAAIHSKAKTILPKTINMEKEQGFLRCDECDMPFTSLKYLQQHKLLFHISVLRPIFKCEQCGQLFFRKKNLDQHVNTVHLKQRLYKCPKCEMRFGTNYNMKDHMNNIHFKIRHPCPHPGCGVSFSKEGNILAHQRKFHSKVLPKTKPRLNQSSKNALRLSQTSIDQDRKLSLQPFVKIIRLNMNNLTCPKCKKIFVTNTSMMEHLNNIHSNTENILPKKKIRPRRTQNAPSLSSKKRTRKSQLNHDRLLHKKKSIIWHCKMCKIPFTFFKDLRQHKLLLHNSAKRRIFDCKQCGQLFSDRSNRNAHVKTIHLKLKPYGCTECGKKFASNKNMREHVNSIHFKTRHPCPYPGCGVGFSKKRNVLAHQRKFHSKVLPKTEPPPDDSKLSLQPFVKVISLKMNNSKGKKLFSTNPTENLNSIHSNILPKNENMPVQNVPSLSLKKRTRKSQLNRPIVECKQCGQLFAHKNNLDMHVKMGHLKLKPYQCTECEMKFSTTSNLRVHQNDVHLKIRHPCPHSGCGASTSNKCNLLRHQRKVHGEVLPLHS